MSAVTKPSRVGLGTSLEQRPKPTARAKVKPRKDESATEEKTVPLRKGGNDKGQIIDTTA